MINRIVDFSARNRALVFALTAIACVWGWWSMHHIRLDAIPDLTDTQVIVYSRWDRSPDMIEDQVTYPIVTALLGAPRVKAVRGFSDFGYSFVYAVFEDGVDLYWARSRTLEYLSATLPNLPQGVKTTLGPDATGLGWIFQYVLVDTSGKHSLADLRRQQDWFLRYHLKSVPGVSEVASVGGFGRQYQVNVDPNRLQARGIGINRVVEAVRGGNNDVGGRLIEFGGTEYMVRGVGYARSIADIENTVLLATSEGTAVRVKDVGEVVAGPELRRGVVDFNGSGDAVSGIIVMRQGENPMDVIRQVKARIREMEPGLPPGMKIVPVYDRSELIQRSMDNLRSTIIEVVLTVALFILIFLGHVPSALIPAITIPVVLLISFVPLQGMGISANIMSLGGIAIAVGALVDAAIVVVEQVHKKLEEWERNGRPGDYSDVVIGAMKEVAGPSFFALLVIGISFLPVLALEAQEGRLFKPLAYTKTLAMVVAAVLAITLDPALRISLTHLRSYSFRPRWLSRAASTVLAGRIRVEDRHPISRFLIRAYEPVVIWAIDNKPIVFTVTAALVLATVPLYSRLGSEFMPPLDEGTILYMPSTMPGISITEAQKLLQVTGRLLKQFPEVDQVLGKAGRADTATDPAPLSMLETVVTLKPQSQWPRIATWYSAWSPEWLKPALRHVTPDHVSTEQLIAGMNQALQIPGLTNAWTMPVKGRIDMLTTGMRTPVGIKVFGADPAIIESIGSRIESVIGSIPGTRSVFSERTGQGYFLDFEWRREELARYGLSIDQAQATIQSAIGGEAVTTVIDGRARYPVNVRYMRDYRSDPASLERVLVPIGDGGKQIPLGQLAKIQVNSGPAMLRDEDGLLARLCVCGHRGSRFERVRTTGPRSHSKECRIAGWLLSPLVRAVRSGGARTRAAAGSGSGNSLDCRPASVLQHAIGGENMHRAVGSPAFGHWGFLVCVSARVQLERGGVGRNHCPAGRGRGDRRVHAALSGSGVYRRAAQADSVHTYRPAEGRARRRRQADPPQVHDRRDHVHRSGSHPVGQWNRCGCHEAHRRADDRRNFHLVLPRIDRLSGDLRSLEVALRSEATRPGSRTVELGTRTRIAVSSGSLRSRVHRTTSLSLEAWARQTLHLRCGFRGLH